MIEKPRRAVSGALLVALLCLPIPVALARQLPPGASPDPEAERDPVAPVLVGGETILWITTGAGPYTPQFRADRIGQRLHDAIRDRSLPDPTVTVTENESSSELRAGSRLLMVVTPQDARNLGAARAAVAQQYARELERAIRSERLRYAPATLIRSGVYSLLATLMLLAAVWLIRRLAGAVQQGATRFRETRAGALRLQQAELVSADRVGRAIDRAIGITRLVLVVLACDLYLTYVLGLFPWTRPLSATLLGYVVSPIRVAAGAVIRYLPNLLFVVVIATFIYWAIRLVGLLFQLIQQGRIAFANFPAEWAAPTNKIVRVLLIAFGLVVAFPYLPASDSPAFAGVSVFMGVLVSLASSSALSNMIAGIVLTYTGAFRLGDRVKVGDAFGDIIEASLLATRVRTIKNEDITIPNSIVLGSSVINYSREAGGRRLILHTSVTIGYDAPWRRVHELLIAAARATPGVLTEPPPFVWQTALNDFYVTYEINACTGSPRDMVDIYAALHSRIQDAFYAAGVEIMSPHFTAIRDGNTIAIPEPSRAPGYRASVFRVECTTPGREASPAEAGVAPRT
ncbi:MAG TPA: mechanosensitive ion channel family protein [Vicinamibacterales bacterium]|nr:mechanosensitive ion channel family protein [Vicinamibacterales bacterium]